MTNSIFLLTLIVLAATAVILLLVLVFRKIPVDPNFLAELSGLIERSNERVERTVRDEISRNREESANALRQSREELAGTLKGVGDTLHQQLMSLTRINEEKLETLRLSVEEKLQAIQVDNAGQLDKMRATVEDKLQGTLETRLGESFRQVSERLEQVYRGLGEMQALASGVGDLKRVLTNVKTRGVWGEVQLGAMLEQVLHPDLYAENLATKESGERVEFAVKLPGRDMGPDEVVWLPIDAKFPMEDYLRLLDVQEKAETEGAEVAARQLENRIRQCARDICEKYINPPKTTDFAVLFLPTEGLFAEVVRRSGLVEYVQREFKVVIAGPSTLWSLLNSLQMGFRTLAIEKRSSEVWTLLAAVKTEWTKYGEVLGKVQKKLFEASETLDKAQTRRRAIGRKLKDVQELPDRQAEAVLGVEEGLEEKNISE
ncbi:MAG: RmuC family protein [Syntrophus sp. PtaU1.Bin208]|nr:MAG: RmuC family protein [Syntrophus sp. PtaU1.Bin208]